MAATGANLARIFINLNRTPGTNTYTISSSDLSYADTVIRGGAQYGYKVVIVFEPLPNQNAEEFWDNTGLQASIAANWKTIAARYKGNTAVAGYDLINEPITKTPWNSGGQAQWLALASQWIADIRSVDPDHVIFFEPSPGGLPMGFAAISSLLPYSNIVYSTHFYQPHEITHQGLYSYTRTISYPSASSSPIGVTNSATLSSTLDPVRRFASANHVPIYVGEFSCARWAPGNSSYLYVNDAITLFEAEKFTWTYHAWREYQGWDAEIPSSYFQSLPYVNAMPQGFDQVNTATLRSGSTDTMLLLKQYFRLNSGH